MYPRNLGHSSDIRKRHVSINLVNMLTIGININMLTCAAIGKKIPGHYQKKC